MAESLHAVDFLLYTLAAGLIAGLTSPFPGTSLILTGVEVLMIVNLANLHFS